MNTEQGFTLHPGAAEDITDIWEFIVEDNPLALLGVYVKTFWTPFASWCCFRLNPFPVDNRRPSR